VTRRELIAWLEEVEMELPVSEWRVRGIRVWPLIRLALYWASFKPGTQERVRGRGVRRGLRVLTGELARWGRAVALDWRANQWPARRADAVFLTYSVGTHPMIAGRRYNPLLAPYAALLQARGKRCSVWELSPFGEYNIPRSVSSAYIQPWVNGLRVYSQHAPVPRHECSLEDYGVFLDRVRRAGLALPYTDVNRLLRDAYFLRLLADRFRGWLQQSGATVGFVVDGGLRQQAFCLACREVGITSVEIQHGVQGEFHPGYGSWFAVPATGYETRPRLFWSWDERSAAAIRKWSAQAPMAHGAIVGGNPWLEWWMRGATDEIRRTEAAIAAHRHEAGGRHHILVTLDAKGQTVPAILADAIRLAPADWRWWLRLHPVDQEERGAQARQALAALGLRLELLDWATAYPLPALLRQMDCHVTMGLSTVVSEAAALGVRSVACDSGAADLYPVEFAQGTLRIAGTAEELTSGVRDCLAAGALPIGPEGADPARAMDELLGVIAAGGKAA
jgi:hypothetical protein